MKNLLTFICLSLWALQLPAADVPMNKPLQDVADFVEPDFPFLFSSLDLGDTPAGTEPNNLTVRGLHVRLDDNHWACFDTDLLRMSVMWKGQFQSLKNMAHTSYNVPGKKTNSGQKSLAKIDGFIRAANGLYAGAQAGPLNMSDPRPEFEDKTEVGRGPLPRSMGRFIEHRISGQYVQLRYEAGGTYIHEVPMMNGKVVRRQIEVSKAGRKPVAIILADAGKGGSVVMRNHSAYVTTAKGRKSTIALAEDSIGELAVHDERWLVLNLPQGKRGAAGVLFVKDSAEGNSALRKAIKNTPELPDFNKGGEGRWTETVTTRVEAGAEEGAFVMDHFRLPLPNPWKRNVRFSALAFFDDGRAALASIDGDVWLTTPLSRDDPFVKWHRYASGLSEPMGIVIRNREIFTFSRSGITRLKDLNKDGEADVYENFCDLPAQSGETREFPMDMKLAPDGSFIIAKGGIHSAGRGKKGAKAVLNGTLVRVASDGSSYEMIAHGLREPFFGIHPKTGFITTSDQQGHAVPSTPIYHVKQDDYFGFHWATHGKQTPIPEPLTWIPHMADNSGAGQVWVTSESMGPLNGTLMHLSYGRPAVFRTFIHETKAFVQGAVVEIPTRLRVPILQGAINPLDGLVYLTGLQIYGSNARDLSGLSRLRFTGRFSALPNQARVFKEGVLLGFDVALESDSAAKAANYLLRRWNYKRTDKYGSPHYKLDGNPGQDDVTVQSAQISQDGRSVFLVVPDMKKSMQLAAHFSIKSTTGMALDHSIYASVHALPSFDPDEYEFGTIDWNKKDAEANTMKKDDTPTVARGEKIYQLFGCMACHSIDGSTAGKTGPSWKGLFDSVRPLKDGKKAKADAAYIKKAIVDPGAELVDGFEPGMPPYLGILSDADIESLILFIKSL